MGDKLPTARGTLNPQLQREWFDFDPTRGYIHGWEYKGMDKNAMAALQAQYSNGGIASRITYNQGDTATLEVLDSTYSTAIDSWQILGTEESRDGLSHPALLNYLGSAAYDVIADMRAAIEQNLGVTEAFATGQPLHGAPNIVVRFYDLQVRGSTEYRHGQYVLRHTTNVSNRWTSNVADWGVDQIYTTAELLTECQDDALWIYPLPGRLAYKIAAIVAPVYQSGYLWGWLKGASTETTAANNRVDITTDFVLEQWSTDYYAPF